MFVYTAQDVASLIAIGILAIIIIFGVVIYKLQNWYDGYSKRHGKKGEDEDEKSNRDR